MGCVDGRGNLFASFNATLQARLAKSHGNNYAFALALVVAVVLLVVALVTSLGPEARGVKFESSG